MGVENRLPDSSFSASSFYQSPQFSFVPSLGRLNGKYAWCASSDDVTIEYLEIHIPDADRICAIATQGTGYKYSDTSLSNPNDSVTNYTVEYSDTGSHWKKMQQVRLFTDCVFLS